MKSSFLFSLFILFGAWSVVAQITADSLVIVNTQWTISPVRK